MRLESDQDLLKPGALFEFFLRVLSISDLCFFFSTHLSLLFLLPLLLNLFSPPPPPTTQTAFALRQQWGYWGYPYLKGWSNVSSPCGAGSSWEGVSCDAGRVVSVSLPDRDLGGSLSPALAALTALKSLNLSSNRVGGSLPSSWGNGKGNFDSLASLSLTNNTLVGEIPASWGKDGALPSLAAFDAGKNTLSGSLPASWGTGGGLKKLSALSLARNNISGPLPSEWGSSVNGSAPLPSLEVLVLDSNKIGGGLPDSWGSARGGSGNTSKASPLKVLSLADNWISGALPESWATGLPNVQILNLAGNSLAGPLPGSWSGRGAFAGARGNGGGVVLLPGNKGLSGSVAPGTPFKVLKSVGGGRFAACGTLPSCGTAPGAPVVAGKLNDVEEQTLTATLELAGADAAAVKAKGDAVAAAVSKVLSKTNAKNVAVSAVVPLSDAPALPGVTAAARGGGGEKEAGGNSTAAASPAPAAPAAAPAAPAPASPSPAKAPSPPPPAGRKLLAPSSSPPPPPPPPAAAAAAEKALESGSGTQVRLTLDALKGDVDAIVKALRSAVKDGTLASELRAAGVPVPSDLSLGSPRAEVDAAVAGGKSKGGGGGKKLSGGAVAGIVVFSLLLAGALAAGLYWLFAVKGYRCADCKLCKLCKSKFCGGAKGGAGAAAEAAAGGDGAKAAAAASAKAAEEGGGKAAAAATKKSGVVPYSEYRRSRLAGAAARDAPVTPRAGDSKK